jgi:hypothetical protein
MTNVNKNRHALFSAPREDGLRLSGMFVLPGDTFRVRWQVKGWGWVVAKTSGDLVEKQTHLFFGETNLEFRLQLGQQIDIQVINPFGRISKRFIAVANIHSKPDLTSKVTENIFSTRFVVDTHSSSKLLRPNFDVLDSLYESLSQNNIRAPDVVRIKPFKVKCIRPIIDSQAFKIPSSQFREFNIAKHWTPDWEHLSAMACNSDTNKGVLNVYP